MFDEIYYLFTLVGVFAVVNWIYSRVKLLVQKITEWTNRVFIRVENPTVVPFEDKEKLMKMCEQYGIKPDSVEINDDMDAILRDYLVDEIHGRSSSYDSKKIPLDDNFLHEYLVNASRSRVNGNDNRDLKKRNEDADKYIKERMKKWHDDKYKLYNLTAELYGNRRGPFNIREY